jgi:hypothetical protein
VGGYLFLGSGSATITNTIGGLVNGIGITAGTYCKACDKNPILLL